MFRVVAHLIAAFTLLLGATDATASTYYVRSWGDDSNSGTSSNPFATIKKAAEVATNGDSVDVGSGNYTDNVTVDNANGTTALTFTASGTATLPAGTQWKVLRSNNVQIIGFTFQGPTDRCFVWRQSTAGLVQNCTFSNGTKGVKVRSGSVTFDNCTIESFSQDGMQIFGTAQVTVQNSTIELCGQSGIEVNENAQLTLQASTVDSNMSDGVTVAAITSTDDQALPSASSGKSLVQDAYDLLDATTWDDDGEGGWDVKLQAMSYLNEALNSSWWLDEYYPTLNEGDDYYHRSASAIAKLMEMLEKQGPGDYDIESSLAISNINLAIQMILDANEATAQLAIDEATSGGGDSGEIAIAQQEMTDADQDEQAQEWFMASEHYFKAWESAAIKAGGSGYGTTTPGGGGSSGSDNDDDATAIAARHVTTQTTTISNNDIGLRLTGDQNLTVQSTVTFTSNTNWGLWLSQGATLNGCQLTSNGVGGLYLDGLSDSDVSFNGVTFTSNGQYAVFAESCNLTFDVVDGWSFNSSDHAIYGHDSQLVVTGLTIENCTTAAVAVSGSSGTLTVTNVTANSNGYGVASTGTSSVAVNGSVFSQNNVGLYASATPSLSVQSSTFNNQSLWGATILAGTPSTTSSTFSACTFANNAGGLTLTNVADGDWSLTGGTEIRDSTSTGLHIEDSWVTLNGQAGNWSLLRNQLSFRASTVVLDGIVVNDAPQYGVHCENSTMTLSNCQVSGMSGVFTTADNISLTLNGSKFTATAAGGLGVRQLGGDAVVTNCVFDGFSTGISLESATLTDDIVVANTTLANISNEGVVVSGGDVTLQNTIVAGSGVNGVAMSGGNLTHSHNLIHGFATAFSGVSADATEVTKPPRFEDAAAGDFQLANGSPAINSGTDLSAWAPADIDCNMRPKFWAFDIGAYEFTSGNGSFRILKWSEQQ